MKVIFWGELRNGSLQSVYGAREEFKKNDSLYNR